MSEHSHLPPDLGHDEFEREVRGYSRRQVDETLAGLRLAMRTAEESKRDLEVRLSQTLDEMERLKLELSAARTNGRPPHEEISERIGQILKLADDEAESQRTKAEEEIATLRSDAKADTDKLRTDVKAETDKSRAEAQEQAERMLSAAQEQAESTVATAKTEAEKARKSAAAESMQVLADATKQSETAVATAKAQAKQQLDEATARATAIHDGAERRLNLLMSRHTEAIRRLTEIRDVVTTLVAGEADRGSLEDEVARSVAGAVAASAAAEAKQTQGQGGRPGPEGRHAGAQPQAGGPGHGPGQPAGAGQHPAAAAGLAQPNTGQPNQAQPNTGQPNEAHQPGAGQHGNGAPHPRAESARGGDQRRSADADDTSGMSVTRD
jgi:chromosome segregation ATPase